MGYILHMQQAQLVEQQGTAQREHVNDGGGIPRLRTFGQGSRIDLEHVNKPARSRKNATTTTTRVLAARKRAAAP